MKYSPIAGYHERYKEGVNDMRLTFNDDYELNYDGSYCPKGMKVKTTDKVHEGIAAEREEQGFLPVVIEYAMDWNDEFIEMEPVTEWFHKNSFKEFEDD